MQLTEKTSQIGPITLSYDETDASGDPMILLHSLTGLRQHWRRNFIATYGDTWHQYAIDLRGHGRSGRASDALHYRLVDYVADIVAFIQRELDAPPVIVGHSLGAIVTIGVGAALGARGLILLDPPLPARELPIDTFPEAYSWFKWVYEITRTAPTYAQVVETVRASNPGAKEQSIQAIATHIHSLAPGTVQAALENRIAEDFEFDGALEKITCPVLLIYAEFGQSGSMREVDAEFVRAHTRTLTTVKMPYDDHRFYQTRWDETQPHIDAFLATV